ncbi:MAG TPA: PKD domain-containing protein, partial [Thermoleophilaceae bacterium]
TGSDPTGLNGSIIRVDPATGAGAPGNPLSASSSANERRIVAYGLRNPFRFAIRPGTSELWIGDVGWRTWEEIDRLPNPADSTADNFGWPCYEGAGIQPGYQAGGFGICSSLYAAPGSVTAPYLAYDHADPVVPGEGCSTEDGSSITGITFTGSNSYPALYRNALFFADAARNCIWYMSAGSDGLPDRSRVGDFVQLAGHPVDLETGPDGNVWYVDLVDGELHRIEYTAGNTPPTAHATASPTAGNVPLTVHFDATGSTDPDPGEQAALSYSWDLDGNGSFGDSSSASPSFTYTAPGSHTARVRVTDPHGAFDTESVAVVAGASPPNVAIDSPAPSFTWAVGDAIRFSGSASDPQDGSLPASDFTWSVVMHHCTAVGCHEHHLQDFAGVKSGSFTAPDHEYPAYLELEVSVKDSYGLTDEQSIRLDPKTVSVTLASDPPGAPIAFNGGVDTAPFTRTVIQGSINSVAAPDSTTASGVSLPFVSWSDSGARAHDIEAASSGTYTARYDTSRLQASLATPGGSPFGGTSASPRLALRRDLRALALALARQGESKLAKRGSVSVPLAAGHPPGRLRVSAYALRASSARSLRLLGGAAVISPKSKRFTLRLTRQARGWLASHRQAKLSLHGWFRGAEGRVYTSRQAVKLRRAGRR